MQLATSKTTLALMDYYEAKGKPEMALAVKELSETMDSWSDNINKLTAMDQTMGRIRRGEVRTYAELELLNRLNPSGLLTLKAAYNMGLMTEDEYLVKRERLLR